LAFPDLISKDPCFTRDTPALWKRKGIELDTKTVLATSVETVVHTNYPPKVTNTEYETVYPVTTVWDTVTREATAVEIGTFTY
jgi:hypothetical protein